MTTHEVSRPSTVYALAATLRILEIARQNPDLYDFDQMFDTWTVPLTEEDLAIVFSDEVDDIIESVITPSLDEIIADLINILTTRD